MRIYALIPIIPIVLAFGSDSLGQAVRSLPYSSQLRTDPSVGNVQGIQRYGRPLKTDPDQGEGYSYHVYPVADQPSVANAHALLTPGPPGMELRAVANATKQIETASRAIQTASGLLEDPDQRVVAEQQIESARRTIQEAGRQLDHLVRSTGPQTLTPWAVAYGATPSPSPYPVPFDWTSGVRSFPIGAGPVTPVGLLAGQNPTMVEQAFPSQQGWTDQDWNAQAWADPGCIQSQALGYSRIRAGAGKGLFQLYHQPLIQIKIRVIEVDRSDELLTNSILEYVSSEGSQPSLTSGRPLNDGRQNLKGITRFGIDGLISGATSGSGGLVNLTAKHINWVASALATEFDADVITAPEMVTLNGQNVEFLAGEKIPFQLGQNVIQGTNNNIQQVFYKHVGTMVSVTPTIVNWGFHGEGQGEAAITAAEVLDWNQLAGWIHRELGIASVSIADTSYELARYGVEDPLSFGQPPIAIPFALKSGLLNVLNDYSRSDLSERGLALNQICGPSCGCQWKPQDCTIDLTVVVRLSDKGTAGMNLDVGGEPTLKAANSEDNVRAVANVIQVKSGHGVVMAGLIGQRELEQATKIPIIGDLPIVGALFRAKSTARAKTEVLIFIEAEVLDPDPSVARAQSSGDFLLGQGYVEGELLDNPLETGMYRVGFGSYLPPHTDAERIFWEKFHRKVRKVHTHIEDTLEP